MHLPLRSEDALSDTLQLLRRIRHYNRWIYDTFKDYVGDHVLEIGAGIGNITALLAERVSGCIFATDMDSLYLAYLADRFQSRSDIRPLHHNALSPFQPPSGEPIDTIVCINVLEHIEADEKALEAMNKSLGPGGHLNLLVPAHEWLYGTIDQSIGHFRRYTRKELVQKLTRAGFIILRIDAFNPFGILGWWLQGKVFHRKSLDKQQTLLFDRLVPILRHLPFQRNRHLGLSWIAIAEKAASTAAKKAAG